MEKSAHKSYLPVKILDIIYLYAKKRIVYVQQSQWFLASLLESPIQQPTDGEGRNL